VAQNKKTRVVTICEHYIGNGLALMTGRILPGRASIPGDAEGPNVVFD